MSKDDDAFRTISEVTADLGVPQHVLRFWETRFPQIQPLKRGGNRRYYRRDEIDLLKAVRCLLYDEGYTIKGVQRILKEQGVRAVAALAREPGKPILETAETSESLPVDESNDRDEVDGPEPTVGLGRQLADIAREIETCMGILANVRTPQGTL